MVENTQQNKITELVIKQNLLLWQMSRSLLEVEKKLIEHDKRNLNVSTQNEI